MTTAEPQAPRRPMRSNARRNYERLLHEARAAFAEQGVNASLEDIARAAGVGIGTLYRHFPTRQALLEALLQDSFSDLESQARDLLAAESPRQALAAWLRILAAHAATYRGLAEALMSTLRDETSALYASCHALHAAGAELLARAKDAGEARADLKSWELFALANAMAWASEQMPGTAGHTDRFLDLLADGLRPEASSR
jgi:AcrR family transcriptional regulator